MSPFLVLLSLFAASFAARAVSVMAPTFGFCLGEVDLARTWSALPGDDLKCSNDDTTPFFNALEALDDGNFIGLQYDNAMGNTGVRFDRAGNVLAGFATHGCAGVEDLCRDPTTGAYYGVTSRSLVSFDGIDTCTIVATYTSGRLVSCAFDADGRLFAHNADHQLLMYLDPVTGAATGDADLDVTFRTMDGAQSMDFDLESGVMYLAMRTNDNHASPDLRTVDVLTGATTLVARLDSADTFSDHALMALVIDEYILFKKSVYSGSAWTAVGDVIQYEYRFVNKQPSASVAFAALTDDTIDDLSACQLPQALAAGDEYSCVVDYTVRAEDITVVNQQRVIVSTATVQPSFGQKLKQVVTAAAQAPTVAIVVSSGGAFSAVGDVVQYLYKLTYAGPDESATFQLADDMHAVDCGDATTIARGVTIMCTASYSVRSADLQVRGVTNTATLTVSDQLGTATYTARANAAPAAALPWTEDVESFGVSINSCHESDSLPSDRLTLYNGIDSNFGHWLVYHGKTQSGTSLIGDHTTGEGQYLVISTAGCDMLVAQTVSPVFDLSKATAPVSLSFWYIMRYANISSLQVDTSIDGGMTWTDNVVPALVGQRLAPFTGEYVQWASNRDDYEQWSIDLDSFVGQEQFRFRVHGSLIDHYSDLALDDFRLSEDAPPVVTCVQGNSTSSMADYGSATDDHSTPTVECSMATADTVMCTATDWRGQTSTCSMSTSGGAPPAGSPDPNDGPKFLTSASVAGVGGLVVGIILMVQTI